MFGGVRSMRGEKQMIYKNITFKADPFSYDLVFDDRIIPPKLCVSEFMSYLKGKSILMLFDRHLEYRSKYGDRHFRARGYYVSTVGNVNEETIRKCI